MSRPFRLAAPGPAVAPRRFPAMGLVVSVAGHVVVGGALTLAVLWASWTTDKVYVVNLVPAVAAVGTPKGAPTPTPAPAPAPPTPTPTPAPVPPAPARPAPSLPPMRPAPEPPREARARQPVELPERSLPAPTALPRPAALPRPGEKDLPPLAAPADRRQPAPVAAVKAGEPAPARPSPPAALGLPTGSVAGSGALSLDVTDFPHAWYLRQVLQKVEESWQRQRQASEPAEKPLVLVEIQRDGSVRPPRIEKTSGNAFYDQAALRAIAEASPFPPLPHEWARPALRVLFRFELRPDRG